jgi:23S rRNA pseudouridine2605 synthase
MPIERLQKIIANAGIASRRKSEELITSGRVSVNGETVTELGAKADPERDHVRVDGKLLRAEQKIYLLLNKPRGYVATVTDPEGRPTVLDLVKGVAGRLYPVGRLDFNSEGLLLLTNDGELAQKLTHASSHVPKTYLVKVSGKPTEESLAKLRSGIVLPPEHGTTAGGQRRRGEGHAVKTAPATITLAREAPNPWYEMTLTEGRNRQIRRMFEQIGHKVEKIKRTSYGSLKLDVESGAFRSLRPEEVARLSRSGERTKQTASGQRKTPTAPAAIKSKPLLKYRPKSASSKRRQNHKQRPR